MCLIYWYGESPIVDNGGNEKKKNHSLSCVEWVLRSSFAKYPAAGEVDENEARHNSDVVKCFSREKWGVVCFHCAN